MKLTRKKSIELCIALWEWLAKTGAEWKVDWPEWAKYGYGSAWASCWFCEYSNQKCKNNIGVNCSECPLGGEPFECNNSYYGEWKKAETVEGRKKYAKLFLAQIKKCK